MSNSIPDNFDDVQVDWAESLERFDLSKIPGGQFRGYALRPGWTTPLWPGADLEVRVLVSGPLEFEEPNTHTVMAYILNADDPTLNMMLFGTVCAATQEIEGQAYAWTMLIHYVDVSLQADSASVHALSAEAACVLDALLGREMPALGMVCFDCAGIDTVRNGETLDQALVERHGYSELTMGASPCAECDRAGDGCSCSSAIYVRAHGEMPTFEVARAPLVEA